MSDTRDGDWFWRAVAYGLLVSAVACLVAVGIAWGLAMIWIGWPQ